MTGRANLSERIDAARMKREQGGQRRTRRVVMRREGMRCEVLDENAKPRWLVNFCSNDYLGLSQQFSVVNALQETAARDGAGSVASHLVCGHHAIHDALERELADWLGYPRALLFGSGYQANLGVLQSLLGDDDVCVQDRLNHASLIDAARLSGCHLRRYPHADAEGAMRQLKSIADGAAILATDGVFSMDGDLAPLRELAIAARVQQAWMYVDDAHGVGVLGPDGRGSVAAAGLCADQVPLQVATLGKALGGHGAVVVGNAAVIEHLTEVARPYLYTTALPPAQAAASLAAVRQARRDHWRREKLDALIVRFREGAGRHALKLMPSTTPIQPLLCGSNARAVAMAQALEQQGFWVAAIRPPTVPEGCARLRITLSAAHVEAQVDGLVEALARARDNVHDGVVA